MLGNYPYQPMPQNQFGNQLGNQFGMAYGQQHRTDIQMVNGPESASAYQMPPNSRQILMDKNIARFYLVETDATGMKSMRTYDFEEVRETPQPEYLTRQEFDEWRTSHEPAVQSTNANKQTDVEGVYGRHDSRRGKGQS